MNKKVLIGIFAGVAVLAIIIIAMIFARNRPQASATPTSDPGLILTAANQTAEAMVTQIFASTPSATPVTPTPTFDPVQTLAAQTAFAIQTQAAGLTPSPTQTSATTPIPPGPSGERGNLCRRCHHPGRHGDRPGSCLQKNLEAAERRQLHLDDILFICIY